ncbi:MAG: Ig-like domain-containing protein [Kofleriaceae bacterium]
MRTIWLAALLLACGNKPASSPGGGSAVVTPADDKPGLDLVVSNGTQAAPPVDRTKLAPAQKLADTGPLFARAKPLAPADVEPSALRPASTPPPLTGERVTTSFPPPPSLKEPPPATSSTAPLHVTRYMPEGKLDEAPRLTVTFDQPMVAITSQSAAATVQPVTLTPAVKGHWRWIGTRTIEFDPDGGRFPMATTYRVAIASGTKGVVGAPLAKAIEFTFETPPPKVIASQPSGGQVELDEPILLVFDQRIDPQAVIAALRVTSTGNHPDVKDDPWQPAKQLPVRVQALDPAQYDKRLSARIAELGKDAAGRWLVVRAVDKLAPDAQIAVTLPVGLGSLEGPNRTTEPQAWAFSTYPPFDFDSTSCAKETCAPTGYLAVNFTNEIDIASFKDDQVEVVPAIKDLHLQVSDTRLILMGSVQANTTYKVEIKQALHDVHHQALRHDVVATLPTGPAQATFGGASGTILLDPAATPELSYFSAQYTALNVSLYRVTPADYPAFQRGRWTGPHAKPPGTELPFRQIKIHGDGLAETHVDLSAALANGRGQVVAVVAPAPWTDLEHPPPQQIVWAQATHLAIDAHVDRDELVVFATDLATGTPVADATIVLAPAGTTAKTDARGLATLALPPSIIHTADEILGHELAYLVARHGEDVTILAGDVWEHEAIGPQLAWETFDDRDLYRPGEEVTIKGWIRVVDPNKHGDVAGVAKRVSGVHYTVADSEGTPIAHGDTKLNELGGFDLRFTLPKTPNLGEATVTFEARGAIKSTSMQVVRIEEFRRPDFDASAHPQTEPFVVGGGGDVTVGAHYYAGGPLGGAKVNWRLHADETTYRPPDHDDYTFGTWTAWWPMNRWGGDRSQALPRPISDWSLEGKTDGGGEHVLHVDARHVAPAKPYAVSAEATITAPNNQTWTARTSFIVHPASLYVGVMGKRPFVVQGEPYELSVIGVDLDGKPAPGAAVTVETVRSVTTWANGKAEVKEVDAQRCAVTTAVAAVACKLATPHGGEYIVRAVIVDAKGRSNRTETQFWVAGDDENLRARGSSQQQLVEIIPDKKDYAPGNTAELLIRAPFAPAEGVVTYRRSGIIKTERITLATETAVITVPITDDLVPNVVVQVDLVGAQPTLDAHGVAQKTTQPAYAVGSIDLSIPPRERTLAVTVTPSAAKLAPGDQASVTVAVHDAAGKPVANADVAVFVVDDSILTLAGYRVADPLAVFYQARPTDTTDYYARAYLTQAMQRGERDGWEALETGYEYRRGIGNGPGTGTGYGFGAGRGGFKNKGVAEHAYFDLLEQAPAKSRTVNQEMPDPNADRDSDGIPDEVDKMPTTEIAVRSNFNPLAVFAPAATTTADGSVTVPVTMPDNLTRYRVIAVVAAGERQFGKGESTMTARLPLMVRATPPRFLSFGDTFQLPITLQNQTDAAMQVKLAVRVSNLALTDGDGRVVTVPANDQILVEMPVSAVAAGTARLQIVAASGAVGDAQELELPVWTPATTEAFATYGVIDDGAIRQPIALPPGVLPQFGGIEVSTASTNLQALTDALIYLVHYPFECAEQRSSRILAIAGLKDVLAAFHAKDLPSPAALATSVAVDVEAIAKLQGGDGGFSYWGDRPSVPYLSVYVPFALAHAKAKGFAVPPPLFTSSLRYLRTIDEHIPVTYSREERLVIEAFALATRAQLGDDVHAEAKLLAAAKLPVDAMGWVLASLASGATAERASLEQQLAQHITETAGAASVVSGYGDDGYLVLGSDGRSAGIVLDALIQAQPTSELIPKLVTGLLASRRQGRWSSTQENGFVLIALDRYFQTYEKITPSFVARVWLGADYAGDHAFRGRTTETASIAIPMSAVATHDKSDLVIQKDGSGRLYYRIGTSYAPADLHIAAADHGFVVERSYEAVDDPKDVTRDAQGIWHVKVGARVRVRISMVNDGQRHHVALVDPMPAGFEAVNPELAGVAAIPDDPKDAPADRYWWWRSAWYEHQNMRDERVEAFTSNLWEGVHAYDYIARATTRGTFVAAPPKAEEMYMPETFGRGASERVVVE